MEEDKMSNFKKHWRISVIILIVGLCCAFPLILIKCIFGEHVLANFCLYSLPSAIGTFVSLIVNKEEKIKWEKI